MEPIEKEILLLSDVILNNHLNGDSYYTNLIDVLEQERNLLFEKLHDL